MVEGLSRKIDIKIRISAAGAAIEQCLIVTTTLFGGGSLSVSSFIAAGFKQRVFLNFFSEKRLNLKIREREQTNGLLQLRRHDQRLALP